MRNANAQREDTMIRVSASQQPPKPHVSHAEIGGRFICSNAVADRRRGRLREQAVRYGSHCAVSGSEIPQKPGCGEIPNCGAVPEVYDGQRCALLTTKSRNTCTRATDFNSSG